MATDYAFHIPLRGIQSWQFDGDTLSLEGTARLSMGDVTQMLLRIGHDMEMELTTPEQTLKVPGPSGSKPADHAIWVGLVREVLKVLPEDAALVTAPKPSLIWMARAILAGAAMGGIVMAASNGFEIIAVCIGLAVFAMGLFLAWSFGGFDGLLPLARDVTGLRLTNMSVHLSREGHEAPILRRHRSSSHPCFR